MTDADSGCHTEQNLLGIDINSFFTRLDGNNHNKIGRSVSCYSAPKIRITDHDRDSTDDENISSEDAEGSTQTPCRLHRRSALRRVHTLTGEPSSPRTGRNNRQRSPSTPNAPDPKMLQRGMDPGGGGRDKFSLTIELEGIKETIRLPARKDHDLKEVLEETLSKKGLTLDDIEIFINNTNSNPLPKNDKGLRVPTEPLGGLEVFIKPAKEKTPGAETCPVTATKKKKDLSAFLGVKDDVSSKAQMDPKLIKLQNELDHYLVQGLPGFPPLLSLQYQRNGNEDPKLLYMENSWKDMIDIDIRNAMSKKAKELQEGIWELLATEAKYIKQIRVIIDLYMCCLLNLQTEAILNEIETEKIFSNITALELAHTTFWKENLLKIVEKARNSGKPMDPHDIATAFEDFTDHFTAYYKFCAEEDSCVQYVREKRQENNILRAFFEWCESHNITRQMRLRGLGDLLIYPMQRVTKYHLMVERVQKNCEDEVAKAALKKTFDNIVEFVTHINHEIKKEQERKKMEKVAEILDGYEVPNAPTGCDELSRLVEAHSVFDVRSPMPYASQIHPRWLLLEGALKLQEKTGRSRLYAFLFTDALVLAKQSGNTGEKYRVVRSPMRVDQLEVIELKDGTGFAVLCVDDYNCAMTGFVAWPEKEKTVAHWMEKIGQAKDLYNKCCSIDDDVEYFDEMPTDDPQTPIVALIEDHRLNPQQGFNYGSSPIPSPQQSPQPERANRRSSNSPSSHGSSSSLQRMAEEEEYAVQNGDKKPVVNGNGVQENNSNNQSVGQPKTVPPQTLPKTQPRPHLKPLLTKTTAYQETDFPNDDSLLSDIVTDIPNADNKSGLITVMRRLSTGTPPEETPRTPMMSPSRVPHERIMSFESSDEDDEGDKSAITTDIYFQPPKNKKDASPKRQKGTVLSATPAASKHHRPSMPNIHVQEKKENGKTNSNGEGTLKKKNKIWEKMQPNRIK